ncbi:Secretin and TonB N terminus short domain-containing protein [Methylocapsa palsarum]|uniref:Secretin and TonB N terminus short domain-containing protein n=1 Tax=Methylocapsa palsarum TaxID=1612308 RepID=A0A1I4BKT9_9HYPH|nr:Secretin and TonB N terminus short domain-containing protein [Methylocapsa palsarum]
MSRHPHSPIERVRGERRGFLPSGNGKGRTMTTLTRSKRRKPRAGSPSIATAALTLLTVGSGALGFSVSAAQASTPAESYEIPAGPVASALNRLADKSGAQLIYDSGLTRNVRTQGLKGEHTLDEALNTLLWGTGLAYRLAADGKAVAIMLAQNDSGTQSDTGVELPEVSAAAPVALAGGGGQGVAGEGVGDSVAGAGLADGSQATRSTSRRPPSLGKATSRSCKRPGRFRSFRARSSMISRRCLSATRLSETSAACNSPAIPFMSGSQYVASTRHRTFRTIWRCRPSFISRRPTSSRSRC